MRATIEGPAARVWPATGRTRALGGAMDNDITSAWADFINGWGARHGQEPVTLAQVAALPGAHRWMQSSGTRQELGASISNHASLHATLRPIRLRGRYAYKTRAGRVRKPALWALVEVVEQGVAS